MKMVVMRKKEAIGLLGDERKPPDKKLVFVSQYLVQRSVNPLFKVYTINNGFWVVWVGCREQPDCLRHYNQCPRLATVLADFWRHPGVRLRHELPWHDLITQNSLPWYSAWDFSAACYGPRDVQRDQPEHSVPLETERATSSTARQEDLALSRRHDTAQRAHHVSVRRPVPQRGDDQRLGGRLARCRRIRRTLAWHALEVQEARKIRERVPQP